MKARVIKTGKIIDVRHVRDISGNVFYEEIGVPASSPRWYAYWRSELDFDLSEPEEEVTIDGWVARDAQEGQDGIGSGEIYLYPCKPMRKEKWFAMPQYVEYNAAIRLDKSLFPSITFQNSPQKVTITIKPKKK